MKRFYLSLLAIVAIAALTTAGSLALFTATTSNTGNTFTAGTVTLGEVAETLVDVSNIAPGDTGSATYQVTYTGSLDAWIGLDTTASGELLSCDSANSLQVQINGGAYNINGANQVVGSAPVGTGAVQNFTVTWNLPSAAGNSCQGDSAAISMLVHAVQARNNTSGTGPASWN